VPRQVIADGRTNYDRWRLARADARAAGAMPTVQFDTVRHWTADESMPLPAAADSAAIRIERVLPDGSAMSRERIAHGGQALGLLVHAVLAQAALESDDDELAAVAENESRALGLSSEQATTAAAIVSRTLGHELLERARRAERRRACRREAPVTLQLADGTLIEGIVDLAFEEDGEWTIVDYKTDRELAAAGEERYRRQVALYSAAIAAATARPAHGVILLI